VTCAGPAGKAGDGPQTTQVVMNDGSEAGMWLTVSNKSYDFAYTRDHTIERG
jgi:catechol 2,3-dioxygenase